MQHNDQETYCAAQDLLNRGTPFGRISLFRKLGGVTRKPEADAFLPEEDVWQATLRGVTNTGDCCDDAIIAWATTALAIIKPRATDGRPDCPYNGQGIAIGTTPAA